MRQDERVDNDKIGITGVSWGGVTVSQLIGYDTRYSFAIPVYGSAYLGNEIRSFDNFDEAYPASLWLAEDNLDNAVNENMPIFWYSYNDDTNFGVPAYVASYLHTKESNAKNAFLMQGDWGHSHGAVFNTENSLIFADWVTYDKGGFITFDTQPEGRDISCTIDIPEDVTGDISAMLYYITDEMSYSKFDKFGKGTATYLDEYWQKDLTCLTVIRDTANPTKATVSGVVPRNTRGYYIQLFYQIENLDTSVSDNSSSSIYVALDSAIADTDAVITVKAKDYTDSANVQAYKEEYVQYITSSGEGHTSWNINVADTGIYTVTVTGNGTLGTSDAVKGKLYIDGDLKLAKAVMNTDGKWNVITNPLETELGGVSLTSGPHTIKFVAEGGEAYIMDKLVLVSGGTVGPEVDDDDQGGAGEGGNEGGGSNPGGAGGEETGTITIEAESYDTDTAVNITAYANKSGYEGLAAAHYAENGETIASTVWSNITIATAGNYTIKTVGTGNVNAGKTGSVTINGVTRTANLVTNGGWNPWANALETEIGVVNLEAGTYSMKLEVSGGNYVCDKILLVPGGTLEPDDGSGGEGTGSGNEGSGGSGTGSEGSGNAGTGSEGTGSGNTGAGDESNAEDSPIIIEAESYIANENVDLKKWDGYAGIAVQYADDASGKTYSTTWKVNVEKDGMYSFAAFGNGTILDGQTAIAGKLYVGDELKLTKDLTTGNAWNVFAEGQCLETALGFVELTAGEYSIKFETAGGTYVMDKLVITQANTITIEAENNTAKVDAVDYTKPEYPDQAAVQYQFDLADTGLPYTTHAFTVDIPGIYTFKTIGTGMVTPQSQYSSIIGKMYIGDELKLTKDLQTNEKYNVFDSNNRLESVLGATWLNAGTYTGKFEIEGGYYVLDKLLLVPGGTIEEDDSGTGGEGSGSGNEGGGSSGNEGSGSNPGDAGNEEAETITIEAESYDTDTAVNITSYANKTGYEGLAAAHYAENGEASASTVWSNITIATAGNYTIKTIGTGNANEDKTGTVTIDGVTRTANLVTNGGWNPWANPLETEIGVVSLEAGTYSIKLEVSGGNYVCDKLLLVPGGTIESN